MIFAYIKASVCLTCYTHTNFSNSFYSVAPSGKCWTIITNTLGNLFNSCWHLWSRLILQLSFNCWTNMRLNDLSCRSYFAIRHTDDREIPVSRWISHGVLWLCGASSWLQIKSATVAMFCAVRADRRRPLPRRLSITPVASILTADCPSWLCSMLSEEIVVLVSQLHCFASANPLSWSNYL